MNIHKLVAKPVKQMFAGKYGAQSVGAVADTR